MLEKMLIILHHRSLFQQLQVEVAHEDYNHVVENEARLIALSIEEEMAQEGRGREKGATHLPHRRHRNE